MLLLKAKFTYKEQQCILIEEQIKGNQSNDHFYLYKLIV